MGTDTGDVLVMQNTADHPAGHGQTITDRLRRTFALSLFALVGLVVTVGVLVVTLADAQGWVFHTREVARLARTAFSLAVDRDRAIRGYLLTGNPEFVVPERMERLPLRRAVDSLVLLVRVPEQRERARQIRAALDRWEGEFALRAAAADADERRMLRDMHQLDKPLFDPLREGFLEFLRVEDQLYRAGVRRLRTLQLIELAVLLGEIFVLAWLLRRFRDQLVRQADQLLEREARLTEQTSELRKTAEALEGANASLRAEMKQREAGERSIRGLNEDLARRLNDLAASNAQLETMSYSIAHDLRTPLRGLDGFSQILLEDYAGQLDQTGRSYLERIRANSQRMGYLIDAILGLARISRGEIRREVVDLTALAKSTAEELRNAEPARRVTFCIAEGVVADGDRQLLALVLQNLLANAWKFTRPRAEARIEFATRSWNGEQVYFVSDNGVGFDLAYAGKLFAAFERLHPRSDFEGHGLGLAMVQRVVQRHGGRVWAEGEVGRGATFYFTLRTPDVSEEQGDPAGRG